MEMIVTIVCSSITMFPVSGWNLKLRCCPTFQTTRMGTGAVWRGRVYQRSEDLPCAQAIPQGATTTRGASHRIK